MSDISGIYIHIPFCMKRCSYCAFASSLYNQEKADQYLDALCAEIRLRAADLHPRSIYIGGGTPTSLTISQLGQLAEMLSLIDMSRLHEFTIEANPGTLDMEKAMLIKSMGVTRISLGVQTFQSKGLEILGRIHTAGQAIKSIIQAREAGFDELSLDFIFGWPGQSEADWWDDLEQTRHLKVQHLSCYCLSYEEETPLTLQMKGLSIRPAEEELERRLFDLTAAILKHHGLLRYEISSFAVPGHECQHNLGYWQGDEYIGVGAGAHSYIDGTRLANADDIERYIDLMQSQSDAVDFTELLEPEKAAREQAVICLRLSAGIDRDRFFSTTGFELEELLSEELPPLLAAGWLEWQDRRLRLTDKALPVADSVLSELV